MEDAKVVVIGAGVAGISAASHLIENGKCMQYHEKYS